MLDLLCESCKLPLNIDYTNTLSVFLEDVDYMSDSIDNIKAKASNLSVNYFCSYCDLQYSYTIDTIINKFLERVEYDIKNYRKIHIFKNYINPLLIQPDNGIIYCNNCTGIDNLGNCYIDIHKQCPYGVKKDEL